MAEDAPLTRTEKVALKLAELANEDPRGKWLQTHWLRGVSYVWVRAGISRRCLTEGLDEVSSLRPETGVLLVANHRSFFDSYVLLLSCYMGKIPWSKSLQFPVRSNFFYDQPIGMLVNAAIAGGAMYPPIFRDKERRKLNDEALDRMVEILKKPGNVLGMHPEGTRNKGDDPYTLLPAQPGVGKVALLSKPVVIPAFINGLGNNVVDDVRATYTKEARKSRAIISVFGPPVDYADLMAEKPRPTLYKKCADRFMAEVKKLSIREKEIRADIMAGRVDEGDPRWLDNRKVSKLYAHEG
ncbi:MAG TPA: lysophospholipid acyltransferase family protein [Kofleriaceae bacterium]|jgi:1-acyl-sn-glycerol-3-phosphate acyltransferase